MSKQVDDKAWKVSDLLERLSTEDPYELLRSEMDRLAGRLEARGLQRVRVEITYAPGEEDVLMIAIRARCPCGSEAMTSAERWPLNLFQEGPHTVNLRLMHMEKAVVDHLHRPGR
jgi:hypothetical protein